MEKVEIRRRDLRSIAREVGINFGSVQAILTDVYGMSKVSARWIPRQLTDNQKRTRLDKIFFVSLRE
jgi:hypothetical protein